MRVCVSVVYIGIAFLVLGCAKRAPEVPADFHYEQLGERVVIDEPFLARQLAGVVVDEAGNPIEAALVEITAKHGGDRISARLTDPEGRFDFNTARTGQYFIRITKPGMAPMWVILKISQSAPEKVTFMMYVAT